MDTITSDTLLEAIRDGQDDKAWHRFIVRYRPMIQAFAKRLGLGDSDAEDVSQETLLAFLQSYREGQYNRARGRLRSWLFGIAHCKVIDTQRKKIREVAMGEKTGATGFFTRIESPDEVERLWDEEWQRSILRACLEDVAKDVTPQTLAAFECYVLKGWPVDDVARHLGMPTNAVYIAKNRILSQVRKRKQELEDIW